MIEENIDMKILNWLFRTPQENKLINIWKREINSNKYQTIKDCYLNVGKYKFFSWTEYDNKH